MAGNAAFRTDSQRGAVTVLIKSHRAGVISHGRMWFELVKLIRVARVNGADLGNRIDRKLSAAVILLAKSMINAIND